MCAHIGANISCKINQEFCYTDKQSNKSITILVAGTHCISRLLSLTYSNFKLIWHCAEEIAYTLHHYSDYQFIMTYNIANSLCVTMCIDVACESSVQYS